MRKKITFKWDAAEYENDLEHIPELREYLSRDFDGVPDKELIKAYAQWSDTAYCAGWLGPDPDSVSQFEDDVVLVRDYSGWYPLMWGMVGALLGFLVTAALMSHYFLGGFQSIY